MEAKTHEIIPMMMKQQYAVYADAAMLIYTENYGTRTCDAILTRQSRKEHREKLKRPKILKKRVNMRETLFVGALRLEKISFPFI